MQTAKPFYPLVSTGFDLDLPLRVFPEQEGAEHAGFAFPMLLDESSPVGRAELCAALEAKQIQTWPILRLKPARQPEQTWKGCE